MRMARGWSLGRLAQRAGVHKSALSRWEAGEQQPRIPELEATLQALEATPAQRVSALACIDAPRALRRLHAGAAPDAMGPLPSSGDLLRALRLRVAGTQEQVAHQVGVGQSTVARWERGERLPSVEQRERLCRALQARPEESAVLISGRFSETSEEIPTDREALHELLIPLLYDPRAELVDLRFLRIERGLWQQAARDERRQTLLAFAYAAHAHYLGNFKRWAEARTAAQRALALTPREGAPPDYALRAMLKLAAADVYSGSRPAPERGIRRIRSWLPRSKNIEYTAWMFSDLGKYLALAGQNEEAVQVGEQATHITRLEHKMRTLDYCRLLAATGHAKRAIGCLPENSRPGGEICAYHALIRCEAHLALGERADAAVWLARAYAVIDAEHIEHDRPHADALARHF